MTSGIIVTTLAVAAGNRWAHRVADDETVNGAP